MESKLPLPKWHELYTTLSQYRSERESFHDFLLKHCGIELRFKGDEITPIVKSKKRYLVAKLKYNIEL